MALLMPKVGYDYTIEGKRYTYRGKDRGKLRFVGPTKKIGGVYFAGPRETLDVTDFNVGIQTGDVDGVTRLA